MTSADQIAMGAVSPSSRPQDATTRVYGYSACQPVLGAGLRSVPVQERLRAFSRHVIDGLVIGFLASLVLLPIIQLLIIAYLLL